MTIPPNPTSPSPFSVKTDTPPWLHTSCLILASTSALAMLLPPRRLDLRLLLLSTTFTLSTSQLAYDYTGQSIFTRFGSRLEAVGAIGQPDLSERAREVQRLLREEKMRGMSEGERAEVERKKKGEMGWVKRVWLGKEGEDWKVKRLEEDRRALEEGKGISGIIMDQISEVFSSGGDEKKK